MFETLSYSSHLDSCQSPSLRGDIERSVYGNFRQAAAKIYQDSGIPGFYRGATFRYGRMVCAVFIMDYTKEFFSKLMYPSAFQK
jgi:hypothetical protein